MEPNEQRKATIEIVARFVDLMHARERGETVKAGDASDQLSRLGVDVRFAEGGGDHE